MQFCILLEKCRDESIKLNSECSTFNRKDLNNILEYRFSETMKYDPEIHHRHSVRMKEYDYSQPGDYLVTMCTKQNVHLMGEFKDSSLVLSKYGIIIETWLKNISAKYSNVIIDKYVLMPNHVHAIISIRSKTDSRCEGEVTSPLPAAEVEQKRPTLGAIVAYFKYQSTKEINEKFGVPGEPIWHRNYFEHIIKNEVELAEIRNWIDGNPENWNKYYQHM